MSSYRSSYTSWKSSLPSTFKSSTSNTYSSRDDVSSTSRYSTALSSPTTYRPSFSGGTYRLKRDTTSTPSSVPSSPYISRYTGASSNSSLTGKSESDSMTSKTPTQLRRYGSSSSSLGKWSREPSPVALEHTNRIRSRDPSPVTRPLRGKSRDPSPVTDNRSKIGYSSLSSYRMNMAKGPPPTSYASRYGSSSATRTPSSTSLPDKSISYLTANDYRARTISKAREEEERKSKEKELEKESKNEFKEKTPESKPPDLVNNESENSSSTEESDTSEDDDEDEEVAKATQPQAEQFIAVSVCTRATSPNPPGTVRTNQTTNHIAMTVERTMLRSTIKRKMVEKEMQSERLEDTNKQSRLTLMNRLSPYSPRSERRSPSNIRYSTSPLSTTSKSNSISTNDSRREESTTSGSGSTGRSLNSPILKSKLSPPKMGTIKSRQSSVENLSPNKPPLGLKADSPLKTSASTSPSSSSPCRSNLKLPNKDFRKSSLNVGPVDRPRKSRTPSTGNDSDLNTVEALNGALQAIQRLERSPSNCSEISNISNRSVRSRNVPESKLRPRCHNKPKGGVTPPSPLSRQNSGTNFRAKIVTPVSPLAMRSSKMAVVAVPISSSSGTESSAEVKKPLKKVVKKKAIKDVPSTSTSSSLPSSSPNDSEVQSLNEKSPQPPVASVSAATAAVIGKSKKSSESSTSTKKASGLPRTEKDPLKRLKKLSSVSNFFVTQQKNTTNSDDQIYLESSETSGGGLAGNGEATSGSTDIEVGSVKSTKSSKKSNSITRSNEPKTTTTKQTKTNGTSVSANNSLSSATNSASESLSERPQRIAKTSSSKSTVSGKSKLKTKTKSKSLTESENTSSSSYCPQNSSSLNESSRMPTELESESVSPYGTTTTTTANTSNNGTDSEEPSWWQDTSQQVDTSSALDYSLKDEMRFKVRHNDSGEVAWWLRNDDNDTLADDLSNLNQDEEAVDIFDEVTETNENSSPKVSKDDNTSSDWWLTEENETKAIEQTDKTLAKESSEEFKTNGYYDESKDLRPKTFVRSHLTPETDWWLDDDEENVSNTPQSVISESPPKQNGTIQLKICRVESGDQAWWDQNGIGETQAPQEENNSIPIQEANMPPTPETSDQSAGSSPKKSWWMSGPTKKLFNIPRVESGEKAWWMDSPEDKDKNRSKSKSKESEVLSNDTDQSEPAKMIFNIPRVYSGQKDWWIDSSEEKEKNRSKSKSKESEVLSNDTAQSEAGKRVFNIARVESGEKAWWLDNPTEKQRSKSRDSDRINNGNARAESEETKPAKLFNITRLDIEEKPWWMEEDCEKGKSRSKSSDSEKWQQQSNPSTPNEYQNIWNNMEPNIANLQSLQKQKELWLEENNRKCKEESEKAYYQQLQQEQQQQQDYSATSPDPWYPSESPIKFLRQTSAQSNFETFQEDSELQQYNFPQTTTFPPPPPQRNESHSELSNSFNFTYSERPPPLGQCASPVQNEEETAVTPAPQRENQCSSPFDNIPMTKVQQITATTPIALGISSTTTPTSPLPSNLMPIFSNSSTLPINVNNNNANNNALLYQQQQQKQQYSESQNQQDQQQQHQPQYQQYVQQRSSPQQHQSSPPYSKNIDLRSKNSKLFISRHQNIDELLSGSCPLFFDNESFSSMPNKHANMFIEEVTPDQVRIHDSTAQVPYIQRMERDWDRNSPPQLTSKSITPTRYEHKKIDDAAIQVYKDGDYGSYLDLESSLAEQSEEIEGLNTSRKNSLVVRTQLSVRVHAIIEKLLSAEGSDLRRALFSLKQVFQEDKDLVHAFVALGGLNCLVRVGNGADQNYQNYILRALGQVMLYVDGMNGVMKHEPTMQWLYSLIASNYRSVVKTALKLLLVFVEYAESNCHVLVSAIHSVDKQQGTLPWSNIMRLLKDYDNADAELVIYAASLINKTLEGLNDQDSFYDESDLLEQQGMESVIQHYMSKPGTDMDLINQLQLYEAVLKFEDGESDGTRLPDNTLRKTQRFRNSTDTAERRKSRRHSTGTSPGNINKVLPTGNRLTPIQPALDEDSSSSTNSAEFTNGVFGEKNNRDGAGVTPGLRRRRERAERHRSFLKEQQEAAAAVAAAAANGYMNSLEKREDQGLMKNATTKHEEPSSPYKGTPPTTPIKAYMPTTPTSTPTPMQMTYNNINTLSNTSVAPPPPPPPPPPPDLFGYIQMRPTNYYNNSNFNQNKTTSGTVTTPTSSISNAITNNSITNNSNNSNTNITSDAVDYLQINESDNEDKKRLLQLKRDHTVKDLTQKLSNLPTSPTHEDKLQNRIVGDMSGLISKAKEGLAKSKSKGEVSRASSVDQEIKKPEPKKSENELQWEELVRNMARPLQLCDLDFTDLNSEDEKDILAPRGNGRGVPPPPPPMSGGVLPPPVMPHHIVLPPPMMSQSNTSNGSGGSGVIPPPMLSYSGYGNSSLTNSVNSSMNGSINGDMSGMNTIKKNKKTVKLFWKEVREDLIPVAVGKTIWDELPAANIDTQKLEHLFESRAKDLMTKKQQEMNKSKEVIVLDHKRSNAINIAMTKLPPPRAIKAAILKMDATVVTREGIDKLLNMLPTDEEKGKIQEAQMANPELPLGSAEQFLLTLASISELAARLRLWAFRLDFDNSEKEIAEPLMDLKHGIEILRNNRTFKCILSTLLSVGIFLNGAPVKGFQIEYLAKVPEVKDTVHKHSLLHHLCHIVMETCSDTTDLYSEIGPITRASKADFTDLAHQLSQLEHECKASWDRLKLIAKHDCPPQLKQKLVDFLADCAERIIILQIVHRRVMNRYRKFLLWLGVPQHSVADSRPNEFCRILSEFSLEYRTTRERVQQQIEKKANHRERNKTRGKLIVDITKFKTKEDKQDDELKVLLGTPSSDTADGTLTWRRRRAENLRSPIMRQSEENFTDGDDEILESLVKTATKAPGTRTTPRERKRTRHADRKSCFCFDNIHDEHY